MVIFHSYVSLPEGRFIMIFTSCAFLLYVRYLLAGPTSITHKEKNAIEREPKKRPPNKKKRLIH